jgi:hypothetical protein
VKAFWWFREGQVAGMGRPGFNGEHWFALPFAEAALLGWIGQFSSGTRELREFRAHLSAYVPRIFRFYGLDPIAAERELGIFATEAGLTRVLASLGRRMDVFESFAVDGDRLTFRLSRARLREEIEFLRARGIRRILSLTESHHQAEELGAHFALQHVPVPDLGAPRLDQVPAIVRALQESRAEGKPLAVHCLAGIGRTSTMLLAGHIALGEDRSAVEARLRRQNPSFSLSGEQAEFIGRLRPG